LCIQDGQNVIDKLDTRLQETASYLEVTLPATTSQIPPQIAAFQCHQFPGISSLPVSGMKFAFQKHFQYDF
jgi:hypothetical protein